MYRLMPISGEELATFAHDAFPESNLLQSPEFGAAQELIGAKAFHLGVVKQEELVGAMLVIFRSARRGHFMEIPGGPLIDWDNPTLAQFTINALKQFAIEHRAIYVRIRPQVASNPKILATLKGLGLKRSPIHLNAEHTTVLDLTKSNDELLTNMRRQTRYEVRQSEKKGIQVTFATDEVAFKEFYRVQQETAKRQGFYAPSKRELLALHTAFGENARVYKAAIDDKGLAYGLVLISGVEADYYEAASTPEARNYPAAYGLQWQIVQDCRRLKLLRYNLWGIASTNDPKHRFANVTTFKNGFGGTRIDYTPAHDIVVSPLKYYPLHFFEQIRKKARHI